MATVSEDDLPDSLKGTSVPDDDLPDASGVAVTRKKIVENLSRPITWNKGQPLYAEGSLTEGVKTAGKFLGGVGELGLSALSGMAGQAIGGVAGAGRTAYEMAKGQPFDAAADKGADVVKNTAEAMTYQPRTEAGKTIAEVVATPFELASKGLGAAGRATGDVVGPRTGAALETLGENAIDIGGAVTGSAGMARGIKSARAVPRTLTQEQEAIQRMQRGGFLALPSVANPSMMNQAVESLAGRYVAGKISLKNQEITNEKVKEALGMRPTDRLDEASFDAYRDAQGLKYEAVKQLPISFRPDAQYLAKINDLDKSFREIKKVFPGVYNQSELETMRSALSTPATDITPRAVVEVSKQYRAEAKKTLKGSKVTPEETAVAMAKREVADALEELLERNLRNPQQVQLLKDFKEARKSIAIAHDVESATNLSLGKVDAQELRRLLDKGIPFSGTLREIAEAARTMPSVMRNTENLAPSAGLTMSDIGQASILSKIAKGGKYAALAAVRPTVSAVAASRPYQIMMAQPKPKAANPFSMGSAAIGTAPGAVPDMPPPEEEQQ
jgi:hypothetical protein